MRRHTAILSDIHLAQHHPEDVTDPLWMRYRLGQYAPDREVLALVDTLLERSEGDELELVFNGDLFDFDAPWVKDGRSSFDEFTLDEDGCARQMERMLSDHPEFLAAVARVLCAGHRVLITSGNHDIELYWPRVRELFYAAVNRHARLPEPALRERLRFRTWFHLTEDGICIEHGSQYDAFNRVRQPTIPLDATGDRIHLQFGKLMFRRIGTRMGYLNPYYEESFYIGLHNALPVFSRFALTRPSMLVPYFHGCGTVMRDLWRERHSLGRVEEGLALALRETGATKEQIQATLALNPEPAESDFVRIVRQVWWDRFLLALPPLGSIGWGFYSDGRPLLLLTTEREARGQGWDRSTAAGGLYWWRNGDWVAEPGATRDAPAGKVPHPSTLSPAREGAQRL